MGKFNKLPERWTEYIPVGKRMAGTRFIAFKVPLKSMFDVKLSQEQRFSPMDLITSIKEQKEELGLIIDLTCTTRYYCPEELPKTLHYSKIFTAGQEIPDSKTIQQFKRVVTKFLKENTDNDKLIGVHCTHGLNRTGYLVCRYLIDLEGMAPNLAIELFNRSRGHSIERENYILDLQGKPVCNDEVVPNVCRGQERITSGYPPNRTGPGWHHQHYRPRPPPPGMYFNGQCNYGFPAYQPQNRSWPAQNWRWPPVWNPGAPSPHVRLPAPSEHTETPEEDYFLQTHKLPSPEKRPREVPEWRRQGRLSHNSGGSSNPHKNKKPKRT